MIEYKGYIGVFEFEEESQLFQGKVVNIDDLVTFQGKSIAQVKEAFENAVDEYMTWCKKYRRETEQSHHLLKENNTQSDEKK